MPSRDWRLRIQDINEAIDEILQWTEALTFEDFISDKKAIKAVLYDLGIIGEAARNIPPEIQLHYPHIPWRLMGDMRNVIFHEYFQIELTLTWRTIKTNLPLLRLQLEEILVNQGKKSDF